MSSVDLDQTDRPPAGRFLKDYLPEDQAAVEIDVSTWTLSNYRKSGVGPPHTIVGRKIYYRRAGIAAWLADGGTRAPQNDKAANRQPRAKERATSRARRRRREDEATNRPHRG
jgi:hypothetical protein